MKALLINAEKLLGDLTDVNARGEIQWLASVAHNNFLDAGRRADWGSHRIEHELSAQYNIVHGEGMAIAMTAWTKYMAVHKPWRLALLAQRIFGADAYAAAGEQTGQTPEAGEQAGQDTEAALVLSEKLEEFFTHIGLKTRLSQLGIDDRDFETMAKRATRNGKVGHYEPLDAAAIVEILKLAL